jgi:hypothetical protein
MSATPEQRDVAPDSLSRLFHDTDWMMMYGERAALEGLLALARPSVALDIGVARGGSLRCIARHSTEVHAFDLRIDAEISELTNVTAHEGNTRVTLAPWLREASLRGSSVDFALVDADHSETGVYRDLVDLLDSSVLSGFILVHDIHHRSVRRGFNRINWADYPAVQYVDSAFVPGHVTRRREPNLHLEMWGGFALIVVNMRDRIRIPEVFARSIFQDRVYSSAVLETPAVGTLRLLRWLRNLTTTMLTRERENL